MGVEHHAVVRLVAEITGLALDELGLEAESDGFDQWDSLAQLRICMTLEERFGVAVPMERIAELDSIPRLIAFIDDR